MTDAAEPSDAEVIRAVLAGAVELYAVLVDRYQPGVIRLAFGLLGDWEHARDAAQEAFVSAYRSLARFRGDSRFSTWLHRIVVNKCNDEGRDRARRPQPLSRAAAAGEVAEEMLLFVSKCPSGDPGQAIADREINQRLSRAIEGLSPQQRTALVLHVVEDRPIAEVAEIMDCQEGTVKSHLFRANEKLRSGLGALVGTGEM